MRNTVRYMLVAVLATMLFAASQSPSQAATGRPEAGTGIASILPLSGAVVGVAHPVVVTFTDPVSDRRSAERNIKIIAPTHSTGRFLWTNDSVVQWIPERYWPAHTKVVVQVRGLTTGFETGDVVKGVASISAHTFTIFINDELVRTLPASMGKPSRPTPIGSFTALEKQRSVVMDSRTIGIPLNSSEGYLLTAQYAVRVTWGGVYVHSAPWSVDSQGYANVSHGCINLSPDNAAWYFNTVSVGDPIIVDP